MRRSEPGLCQWFHFEAYEDVERTLDALRALGVRRLRTGISWADYHRPGGRAWYDWQMAALGELEVLVSVWHTPPSRGEAPLCNAPPRRLADYAEFVWEVVDRYGDRFEALELWNEPNNRYKWDFARFDPDWSKFAQMVGMAAETARGMGKYTVLGGMMPADPHWLRLIEAHGGLRHVDAVAVHGFPGMWWPGERNWDWYDRWQGWPTRVARIEAAAGGRPVWVTEAGLATWSVEARAPARHGLQVAMLDEAMQAPAERVYWYSVIDLDPRRAAIEGFHVDENEYHLGLSTYGGERKPAWHAMKRWARGRAAAATAAAGVRAEAAEPISGG
ncbi:MAG: hypothetical protein H6701_14305 [Myxococcales bacterium]|nr:hypothetical protein [Myxococcales bacterium]MCB9554349.1 hypothetical protein [Myxococcales bacterium]